MDMSRETIALLCKSFADDLQLSLRLAESVVTWTDLPLVISVPDRDRADFRSAHDSAVTVVADEDVVGQSYPDGWVFQQAVKLHAHRLGSAENYLMLDSDYVLFRRLHADEFLDATGKACFVATSHPYEYSTTNQWLLSRIGGQAGSSDVAVNSTDLPRPPTPAVLEQLADHFTSRVKSDAAIRQLLGAPATADRGFQPAPILNAHVLAGLEDFASELPEGVLSLVKKSPWEYSWYGEFGLASGLLTSRSRQEPGVFTLSDWSHVEHLLQTGFDPEVAGRWFFGFALAARHLSQAQSMAAFRQLCSFTELDHAFTEAAPPPTERLP